MLYITLQAEKWCINFLKDCTLCERDSTSPLNSLSLRKASRIPPHAVSVPVILYFSERNSRVSKSTSRTILSYLLPVSRFKHFSIKFNLEYNLRSICVKMGNNADKEGGPKTAEVEPQKKLKPCCACPETKRPRDACIIEKGEENCGDLIEAHKVCMRKLGFNI